MLTSSEELARILMRTGHKQVLEEYTKLTKENKDNEQIPRFFTSYRVKAHDYTNYFNEMCTEEGLSNVLNRIPRQEDVNNLRDEFEQMVLSPSGLPVLGVKRENRTMRYMQYQQLRMKWPENLQKILNTKLFLAIGGNAPNTMFYDKFFDFLYFLPRAASHFLELRTYDPFRTGTISDKAFLKYLRQFASEMAFVKLQMETNEHFLDQYITIVFSFVFSSIDYLKTGIAPLKSLVTSPFLYYFISLDPDDEDCNFDRNNIFSLSSANFIISEFHEIDSDSDGILSSEDLTHLSTTHLTHTFAEALIGSCTHSEPDFPWFVRFRAAWENLGAVWANSFVYDALDYDADGRIGQEDIDFFIKGCVVEAREAIKNDQIPIKLNLPEIMDTLKFHEGYLTREMFLESKNADFLVKMLADVRFFVLTTTGIDLYASSSDSSSSF